MEALEKGSERFDRHQITHALLELFAQKASGREYFEAVVEVIRT